MKQPLISIIVPVYNIATYLPQSLESLLEQTYTNLQIICVNDGSTDNSAEVLSAYAARDSRLKIINQSNMGPSGARNSGMRHCKGEYMVFLDGDDWLDKDTLEKALALAMQHNADVVMWGYTKEYGTHSQPVCPIAKLTCFAGAELEKLHCRLLGPSAVELKHPEHLDSLATAWGKLYRSDFLKTAGVSFVPLEEIGSAEDVLFNIQAFSYAKTAIYTPFITHHYRKDNISSFTKRHRKNLLNKWMNLFKYMQLCVESLAYRQRAQTALNNRMALSVIGLGLNNLQAPGSKWKQYRNLAHILSSPWYRSAISGMQLKYFPPHWKFFFACSKYRFYLGTFVLLLVISKILKK